MVVTIVGIGEDGVNGLNSPCPFDHRSGGCFSRGRTPSLAMVNTANKIALTWAKPIEKTIEVIKTYTDRSVCVLASGDPLWYGIGKLLLKNIPNAIVIPHLSSFTLACSRLGWSMEDIDQLSLCGRPVSLLISYLSPGRRLLVLGQDEHTPSAIATVLRQTGYDKSRLTVLSHLGGAQESDRDPFRLRGR
jgi:precorrin-6Y C5,15-methyltransferase (decarboxylating)